jgi:acetyl esterase/lipase
MANPEDEDAIPAPTLGERVSRILGVVLGDPAAKAELDMARVLEELKALAPEPVEDLTPQEARRQPWLAHAVRSLTRKAGAALPDAHVRAHDVVYPGSDGDLPARIYRPEGAEGGLPIVLYFHGGGFVLGDLDSYDAGPRAIASRANVVVVSACYRRAPEHKFPAAHDDAVEAYRWAIEEAEGLCGDGQRIALMGEGAGANLAINVAIAARDLGLRPPVHQALIYPAVGVDMETPSYVVNEFARPLNKAMMGWFIGHALLGADQQQDPRIDVVGRADLSRLPSTTIVTAEIDPLRSEGQALAERLRAAGVSVNAVDYEGVTHDFFGMGDLVRHARSAQEVVARDLAAAFAQAERGARSGRAL